MCSRTLFPEPRTEFLAPGRPVLVDTELFRHRFTCFSERGSGSFVPDLIQWGQIGADSEDNGASAWEAGKSVMLGA